VSPVGKLFTGLLNKRFLKWAEQHNILTDAQFGFRPGFGTTDAIFALHSLITSTLRKGYIPVFIILLKSFPKIGIKYALPVIKYSFIKLSNPVDLSHFKSRINTKVDKPWITEDCKNLYRQYKYSLHDFNSNRANENRLDCSNVP
jgi:hypothetical protein